MLTPKQLFNIAAAAVGPTVIYTVTANQKLVGKQLSIANTTATAQTFTLTLAGVALYTNKTVGPYETFSCVAFQNAIALPGDTITFTVSAGASLSAYGSGVETPAT